jgi:hypothetical protein
MATVVSPPSPQRPPASGRGGIFSWKSPKLGGQCQDPGVDGAELAKLRFDASDLADLDVRRQLPAPACQLLLAQPEIPRLGGDRRLPPVRLPWKRGRRGLAFGIHRRQVHLRRPGSIQGWPHRSRRADVFAEFID